MYQNSFNSLAINSKLDFLYASHIYLSSDNFLTSLVNGYQTFVSKALCMKLKQSVITLKKINVISANHKFIVLLILF